MSRIILGTVLLAASLLGFSLVTGFASSAGKVQEKPTACKCGESCHCYAACQNTAKECTCKDCKGKHGK